MRYYDRRPLMTILCWVFIVHTFDGSRLTHPFRQICWNYEFDWQVFMCCIISILVVLKHAQILKLKMISLCYTWLFLVSFVLWDLFLRPILFCLCIKVMVPTIHALYSCYIQSLNCWKECMCYYPLKIHVSDCYCCMMQPFSSSNTSYNSR